MPQICVRFSDNEFNDIEERARHANTTRPRVVQRIVEQGLLQAKGTAGIPEWSITTAGRQEQIQTWKDRLEMFKRQLNQKESEASEHIAMLEQRLSDKETELGFLRMEYAKLSDLVVQKQLPVKSSWWSRHFGRRSSR